MRTINAAPVALVLLVCLPLQAQQLPHSFASLRYAPDSGPASINLGLGEYDKSPTYWAEGALIVGIPFALLGVGVAGWACGGDDGVDNGPCWDNELMGALFGFGVGASLGALIGGQIKKGEKPDTVAQWRSP